MTVYRGTTPLKVYKGDMQPVNVYKGSTKVAGWHSSSYSGQSPLAVDCDYNVPPDALVIDGKCQQAVGVWGTNLVTNGDFSNGTTGWFANGATNVYVSNNTLFFTPTATYGRMSQQPSVIAGHIYYAAARVSVSAPSDKVYLRVTGKVSAFSDFHSGGGSFERLSLNVSATVTGITLIKIEDNRTSDWTTILASYFTFIDLTAAFGAGHEPTAAQMDAYLAQYPNSWFDGSALLTTDTTNYTANSHSPTYPAPISTMTGNITITGADGAASDTVTVALGSAVCASLPDGTCDTYDAVTGVLTHNVGKYTGASGTSWTISNAANNSPFMCDKILAGTLSGQTLTALSTCTPTVYYKLATPTTEQLTPHLPVVRTGIKMLTVGADVTPTIHATVKSMD